MPENDPQIGEVWQVTSRPQVNLETNLETNPAFVIIAEVGKSQTVVLTPQHQVKTPSQRFRQSQANPWKFVRSSVYEAIPSYTPPPCTRTDCQNPGFLTCVRGNGEGLRKEYYCPRHFPVNAIAWSEGEIPDLRSESLSAPQSCPGCTLTDLVEILTYKDYRNNHLWWCIHCNTAWLELPQHVDQEAVNHTLTRLQWSTSWQQVTWKRDNNPRLLLPVWGSFHHQTPLLYGTTGGEVCTISREFTDTGFCGCTIRPLNGPPFAFFGTEGVNSCVLCERLLDPYDGVHSDLTEGRAWRTASGKTYTILSVHPQEGYVRIKSEDGLFHETLALSFFLKHLKPVQVKSIYQDLLDGWL